VDFDEFEKDWVQDIKEAHQRDEEEKMVEKKRKLEKLKKFKELR